MPTAYPSDRISRSPHSCQLFVISLLQKIWAAQENKQGEKTNSHPHALQASATTKTHACSEITPDAKNNQPAAIPTVCSWAETLHFPPAYFFLQCNIKSQTQGKHSIKSCVNRHHLQNTKGKLSMRASSKFILRSNLLGSLMHKKQTYDTSMFCARICLNVSFFVPKFLFSEILANARKI